MRGRLLLVFLLSLSLFLLLNMPARQLFRVLTLPPGVAIGGLEGSLLSGRIARLGYRGVEFRDLTYRFAPSCLLRLAVCYRVANDAGDVSLELGLSPLSGMTIENSRLLLPLEQLGPLMQSLLVRPLGKLDAQIETAQVTRDRRLTALSAQVAWREAGLEGEPRRLGDFLAVLERSEQGIRVRLADQPGALVGVQGALHLGVQEYRIDLELHPRDGLGESARNALGLLGRKTGLNRYRVQRQGRLPAPLDMLK